MARPPSASSISTDLHYKGDRAYAESVVKTINSFSPDLVCFTGDIMEQTRFLPEALEILSGIKSPMFGVPGNHDYSSGASFEVIGQCFAATGGAWLLDEQQTVAGWKNQSRGHDLPGFLQHFTALESRGKNRFADALSGVDKISG